LTKDDVTTLQRFFHFSSRAELGRFLLDSRPVWLFSIDGSHIHWANMPGLEALSLKTLSQAFDTALDDSTPAKRHIRRMAEESGDRPTSRVEILRFLTTPRPQSFACVCRVITIDDERYVLAVASDATAHTEFSDRTQLLIDFLLRSDPKIVAALKDSSGHVLAVSQKSPPQGMAAMALAALSEAIEKTDESLVRSMLNLNGKTIGIGLEFSYDGQIYHLIALEPVYPRST
jgi:hypothetical protein